MQENATQTIPVAELQEMFQKGQIIVGMRTENIEKPQPCLCCGKPSSEYHDVANLDHPACLCTLCALEVTK